MKLLEENVWKTLTVRKDACLCSCTTTTQKNCVNSKVQGYLRTSKQSILQQETPSGYSVILTCFPGDNPEVESLVPKTFPFPSSFLMPFVSPQVLPVLLMTGYKSGLPQLLEFDFIYLSSSQNPGIHLLKITGL